jgi:hypothetical protein
MPPLYLVSGSMHDGPVPDGVLKIAGRTTPAISGRDPADDFG